MHPTRPLALAALALVLAAPLAGQGIPRGARVSQQAVANAPRLMVANPYAFASADSAAAVRVGSAIRARLGTIVARDFTVVPQSQMNDALRQYGYPADAILTPHLATTLAKNIQSRVVVTSTLVRGQGGRYNVTARLAGVNDEAGVVVRASQRPGQSLEQLGEEVAKLLEPGVEALEDARRCVDQRQSNPDKAADAARKALKEVPNHGLASYCLAQLATDRKARAPEVVKHLQAAVRGDSLSLPASLALAQQYQVANDTANTLVAFKHLLRIAPANDKLREEIFKYFLQSGRPQLALQVAEEGLKIDPYNADLYNLKSNACLFLSNFRCAVDALEQLYAVDSTKADTLFFTKATAAAAEGSDTVRLVRWAQAGVRKFPENVTLLRFLNRGYVMSGQVDSSVAITSRLIVKDTTAALPALAAVQSLAQAGRLGEAGPFVEYIQRYGDQQQKDQLAGILLGGVQSLAQEGRIADAAPYVDLLKQYGTPERKEQLAGILVNAALPLLQADSAAGKSPDYVGAAELARQGGELAAPEGKVAASASYVLGLALFLQAANMDAETEKQKSCEMAQQEAELLLQADSALARGEAANADAVKQYRGYVEKFQPRIKAMQKAYCRRQRRS